MSTVQEIVLQIHNSPQLAVLAVSGAGSQAVAWFLGVAGASRTLLEVVVPYGRLSMIDFVGHEPAQFVSAETARDMAQAAYRRAMGLREDNSPVVGLACTATIATDRPKRGEHRCHIAVWDQAGCTSYNLRLAKGHRDRAGEEELVSQLVVHALALACGVECELPPGLSNDDSLAKTETNHPDPVALLLSGDAKTVDVGPGGKMAVDQASHHILLPGSFNPLHRGHLELADTASNYLGHEVVFELSVTNVDKPPLAEDEVTRRVAQFRDKASIVLTRAETFRIKADLFPGCTFVIGWDTAIRLVDPKYYGGDENAMLRALAEIWALGCRFLVAGREENGAFRTLADVAVPQGFAPLFQGIRESQFRADISSTRLRASG